MKDYFKRNWPFWIQTINQYSIPQSCTIYKWQYGRYAIKLYNLKSKDSITEIDVIILFNKLKNN